MTPEIKPTRASIEVCTACNHRCQYCPVTEFPKKQQVMPMDLFARVMSELGESGGRLKRVSFSHYNETLLDPHLTERVRIASALPYIDHILIFSNLSLLRDSLVDDLSFAKQRLVFNINLPTTDRERYKTIHGFDHYSAVEANIDKLLNAGYKLRINAQRNVYTTDDDVNGVEKLFGNRVKVSILQSDDRSGLVPGFDSARHEGRIIGCVTRRVIDFVHIGVEGEVFLCCQDYFKKYQLGNIREQNLKQILSSDKTREYLGYIYGEVDAPNDFLCRSCEFAVCESKEEVRK